jgi:hypothetical protein
MIQKRMKEKSGEREREREKSGERKREIGSCDAVFEC